jgi:hypothetical protein
MSTTAEYDAFGPWIYEIHSDEEVPRLFRGQGLDLASAVMTIKVPREIERRVANPSMDLYDLVLSLGPESVTALARRGKAVDRREVRYVDIQGITDSVDLLRGRLVLHAEGSPLTVAYNASSTDVVGQLVQVLRRQYVSGQPEEGRPSQVRLTIPTTVEDDLQNLYRRVAREEGGGRVLGVQPRRVVTPVGASGVGRAVARAWPTTMQSSVVVLGDREVVVLHRATPFATGHRPVQSLARTLLPLERLVAVDVRPSQTYEGVSVLQLRVGRVTHEVFADAATARNVAQALEPVRPS